MKIDAHQHFWDPKRGDYGWMTPDLEPLYRSFGPDDLKPLIDKAGIDATVLVQAAPTVAETEYILTLADATTFVKGVFGWVDFESDEAPDQIAKFAAHPAFVGLRPMIQDIDDPDWMLRDDLTPAFRALQDHDLTFEALTLPRHLPFLRRLLDRHAGLQVVIDHASKPQIVTGEIREWARDISVLARGATAFCKMSGLVTEARANWQINDLRPYVDVLLSEFGPDLLIWGSDWPVCALACSYEAWVEATAAHLSGLSPDDRAAILGGNALRAYNLGNLSSVD